MPVATEHFSLPSYPGCGIRVSPHFYTTDDEVMRFLDDNRPTLRLRLSENTTWFRHQMSKAGFAILPGAHPIVPVMVNGDRNLHAGKLAPSATGAFGFAAWQHKAGGAPPDRSPGHVAGHRPLRPPNRLRPIKKGPLAVPAAQV